MPTKNIRVEPSAPVEPAPRIAGAASEPRAGAPVPAPGPAVPRAEHAAASAVSAIRQAYAEFIVDPSSDRVRVRIIDSATNEVIREIPPDEMEKVAQGLRDYAQAAQHRRAAANHPNG